MATLVSAGVQVSVIDESQYLSNDFRQTVPLIILATHQDKANPSNTGIAPYTTKANANKPFLISSPRELSQNFGAPVFYNVNGTAQHGYELNEYGLLAAHKTLNITNRAWVVRADIDLAQLVPSSDEPKGAPVNGTYWFDINDTSYGIFKRLNGAWVKVTPKLITDSINLTGAAPAAAYGVNGDIAVVVLNDGTTTGLNKIYEKINGAWYHIGSTAWDTASPTISTGTASSIADSAVLTGLIGTTLTINTGSPSNVQIGGSVRTITLTNAGSGYTSTPTATMPSPGLAGVTSTVGVTMKALAANITTASTGYTLNQILTVSGGTSTTAATLQVTSVGGSGEVTGISVLNAGVYSVLPSNPVSVSSGSAAFTLNWGINGLTITNPGLGYTTATPAVTIGAPNSGVFTQTQATATATAGASRSEAAGFINSASITNTTAAAVAVGTQRALRVTFTGGTGITFSGGANTILQMPNVASNDFYYAPHTMVPSAPVENDIWVKTTSPNFGASYIVKYYNAASGQWELVAAPLYETNIAAFDAYGTSLKSGSLYVRYNVDGDGTASHQIKRFNGGTTLVVTSNALGTPIAGTFNLGNGRDAASTITISGGESVAQVVALINNASIANIVAQVISSTVYKITNTIGEDIIISNESVGSLLASVGLTAGSYSNWAPLRNYAFGTVSSYEAQGDAPASAPAAGTLWYNTALDIDLLVHNGTTWVSYTGDLNLTAIKPTTQSDGLSALVNNDIWVNTGNLEEYPDMYRWIAIQSKWVKIDKTDQTTTQGIIFADARPSSTANLDPDCPNPLAYPSGMLLFNTRASTYNIKEYKPEWFLEGGYDADTDYTVDGYSVGNTNFSALSSAARWVTKSGNKNDGSPYMGRKAQRRAIVIALQASIQGEDIRDYRRNFFNLILTPGYTEMIDEMLALSVDRKETAFVIGDTPFRLENNSSAIQSWATNAAIAPTNGEEALVTRDSDVAVYFPPMGLTTNLDGTEVAMPSSLGAVYVYLYNDNVAYPWYPPAGLNRGTLSGVFTSTGFINDESEYQTVNMSQGLQDTLYTNNINPIVFVPGRGLYVNGQKTLHNQNSALDRVNVARLIVYLRYQLELLAEPFLFELNNKFTRDAVKQTFDRFFSDLVGLNAVYDFLIVCDDSNNTPERIDRNELWIDIAIQPQKAIEFIYIPIRIKNTGENLAN